MTTRIVTIPKPSESARYRTEEPINVPELEAEPERAPRREPIVVLQEPRMERAEPKPLPRAQKQTSSAAGRIGDTLRAARMNRAYDLYLIAEHLCIKPAYLIAIENSRYEELPPDAYVVGFLRSYANLLGVDAKEAVDHYRYEMAGRRKKPILSMPTPVSEGRAPSAILMVGATLAVLLIYALWYGISSANRAELHKQPPLPIATQPVASPEASAAVGMTAPLGETAPPSSSLPIPPAAPGIIVSGTPAAAKEELDKPLQEEKPTAPPVQLTQATKPVDQEKTQDKAKDKGQDANADKQVYGDSAAPSRITIRASQNSWIMVTDDSGKTLFDHVLKPGDSYKVPNKSGLSLTTGNGGGIVLSLDGNDLPKIATGSPHVVRNIMLDPDRMSAALAGSDH